MKLVSSVLMGKHLCVPCVVAVAKFVSFLLDEDKCNQVSGSSKCVCDCWCLLR